ncbi:MAG: transposase [Chloroflexi bacterium]|nr:transposase [Chloroflexota bacterium]
MPIYTRYYIPDSMVFITCVTHRRLPVFENPQNIDLFWSTLAVVRKYYPFNMLAYVILPDHFHWLIQLPPDQPNFSHLIHSFKRNFTLNYKKDRQISEPVKIWQNRFWDHVIRDEEDLHQHLDYIHWNPVKHALVDMPTKWQHSSVGEWVARGLYDGEITLKTIPKITIYTDYE